MESKTPITDAALQQLELRKQFISEYSNKMVAFFTEHVKNVSDETTKGLEEIHQRVLQESKKSAQRIEEVNYEQEKVQNELLQFSKELLQESKQQTIKTDEPTDKQTGTTAYGNE